MAARVYTVAINWSALRHIPSFTCSVANMCQTGLFLRFDRPMQLRVGSRLEIVVDCGHERYALLGIVRRVSFARPTGGALQHSKELPTGCGIRLADESHQAARLVLAKVLNAALIGD
jgi:hypothetical protein